MDHRKIISYVNKKIIKNIYETVIKTIDCWIVSRVGLYKIKMFNFF